MEKVSSGRAPQVLMKEKKKQLKDEIDRLKQAEKKKRRLEKALATSAAIRSELEKKKQKKKEEQERLDEEGAAVAEAVALHVLGEDADESCQFMLKNTKRFDTLDHSSNTGLFLGHQSIANYSTEGLGWLSASYSPWCTWSYSGSGRSMSPAVHVKDLQLPYCENAGQGTNISAGLIAAQGVSSLQIAENLPNDSISGQRAATVINRMLGGNDLHDKVNLYNVF